MDPAIVINRRCCRAWPFDAFKDLRSGFAGELLAWCWWLSPTLPVKTYAEFVAHAKANPGKLNLPPPASAPRRIWSARCQAARRASSRACATYRGIGQS